MRSAIVLGAALGAAGAFTLGRTPEAAAREYLLLPMPPVLRAIELKAAAGYTQGFGSLAPSREIISVAGPGVAVSVDVDYRISPAFSFGIESQYQEFTTQNNASSVGVTFNLGFTYHLLPDRRGDPWLRLGSGYRLLFDVDHVGALGTTNVFHGIQLASLKLGYDIRTSADVALSPFIGADLQTFLWENGAPLPVRLSTFIGAGMQGRFDLAQP